MPTIFAHAASGYTAARLAGVTHHNRRWLLTAALLAVLPDFDGLFFGLIPYRHPLGHRGFTHSLLFAALAGLAAAWVGARGRNLDACSLTKLALLFALTTASHGFFDALTNGGLGVAFFAPFDNARYFLPWRPIPVSPMSGVGLLTSRGLRVLGWELGLFWTFAAAALWDSQRKERLVLAGLCALAGVWAWLSI